MRQRHDSERHQFEMTLLLDALCWRSGSELQRQTLARCAPAKLARIIDALRRDIGVPTITALSERVLHDDGVLQQVQHALTAVLSDTEAASSADPLVNPIQTAWRSHVAPLLRSMPFPTVWVHECDNVELLAQLVLMLADCGLLKRSTVFVTCATTAQIEPLRQQLQHALPSSAVTSGSIIVAEFNIHTDGTFNEFDFIVCGTELHRLASAAQRRVIHLLKESLAPCGVLQLLSTDEIDTADGNAARIAPIFLPMANGTNLYRHALLERYAQQRRHEVL